MKLFLYDLKYIISEKIIKACLWIVKKLDPVKPPDEWFPYYRMNMSLLSGAVESGSKLYLLGSFGGFGGSFHFCYRTLEDAVEAQKKWNQKLSFHLSIYELDIQLKAE